MSQQWWRGLVTWRCSSPRSCPPARGCPGSSSSRRCWWWSSSGETQLWNNYFRYLDIKHQIKADLDIRSILETELRGSSGSVMAWVIHLRLMMIWCFVAVCPQPTSYSGTPSCPRQSCSVCLRCTFHFCWCWEVELSSLKLNLTFKSTFNEILFCSRCSSTQIAFSNKYSDIFEKYCKEEIFTFTFPEFRWWR